MEIIKAIKSTLTLARATVHLKHIAQELKRANELKEQELSLSYPQWVKSGKQVRITAPKLVSIEQADVEEWNRAYDQAHPERD